MYTFITFLVGLLALVVDGQRFFGTPGGSKATFVFKNGVKQEAKEDSGENFPNFLPSGQ